MLDITAENRITSEDTQRRTRTIAARYARYFPQHAEDFQSLASIGAVKAASSYNSDINSSWEYWSRLKITGEIKNWLKKIGMQQFVQLSQSEWIAIEDDRSATEDDSVSDDLKRIFSALPYRHRAIMRLVYFDGMTASDAAVALGMDSSNGRKLHRQAVQMLKDREGL